MRRLSRESDKKAIPHRATGQTPRETIHDERQTIAGRTEAPAAHRKARKGAAPSHLSIAQPATIQPIAGLFTAEMTFSFLRSSFQSGLAFLYNREGRPNWMTFEE